MEQPNLNLREHKNWYFTSVWLHSPLEKKSRWIRFVVLTETKKRAEKIGLKYADIHKKENEHINEINVYRNNYIINAEELIKEEKFCY